MSVDSEDLNFVDVPEIDSVECPLFDVCNLPKHHFLCKVPDCTVLCYDYLTKVKKLKLLDSA